MLARTHQLSLPLAVAAAVALGVPALAQTMPAAPIAQQQGVDVSIQAPDAGAMTVPDTRHSMPTITVTQPSTVTPSVVPTPPAVQQPSAPGFWKTLSSIVISLLS